LRANLWISWRLAPVLDESQSAYHGLLPAKSQAGTCEKIRPQTTWLQIAIYIGVEFQGPVRVGMALAFQAT